MRFALSTNWNNHRLADGAAIADEALALGFDALELGFHTTPEQVPGIRSRLDRLPVDSVQRRGFLHQNTPQHSFLFEGGDHHADGCGIAGGKCLNGYIVFHGFVFLSQP